MVRAPVLIFSSRRLSWYCGSAVNVAVGGGGKENSGVRGYRKIKVQLLQIKCRLQRQKKPQPKPNLNTRKLASQTSCLLTYIVAVWMPPENCAKEFRVQMYNKSKYTTQNRKLQVTILNCKWRKFNVERSDKITIWKLLGLLFFSLIDCNAVLVSCCTSKPTNQ